MNNNSNLKFYGVVDHIETVIIEKEVWYYVLIDCIEAKGLEDQFLNLSQEIKLIDVIDKLALELILIRIPESKKNNLFPFNKIFEGRWLKIISSSEEPSVIKSEILSNFISNQTDDENLQYQILDGRTSPARRLRDGNNLALAAIDYIDQNKAEKILESITLTENAERFVISYNVGQGNAVCINEKAENEDIKPLLYFDIGGGANFNTRTYPIGSTRNFKVDDNTVFILSHWDEDHYETARRDENLLKSCTYIAPVQIVTPRNLNFVKEIIKHGELVLLPKTFTEYSFPIGKLVKSLGQDFRKKNDSGLILMVDLRKENDISTILLPGDTQYNLIPNLKVEKFDAIMATHHGGKLIDNCIPNPIDIDKGCIAYSYGSNNIYKHPLSDSITTHEKGKWGVSIINIKNRLDTSEGDVLFSWFLNNNCKCTNDQYDENSMTFANKIKIRNFKLEIILSDNY